jgi:hypothetical protein
VLLASSALEWAGSLIAHPIFILGAHRSGTTLVRNLLDGHPELSVLPSEGNLLTNFQRRLRWLKLPERTATLCRIWIARFVLSEEVPPFWLLGRSGPQGSPYVTFARRVITWARAPGVMELGAPYDAFLAVILAFTESIRTSQEIGRIRHWVEKSPLHELHLKTSLRRFPDARCVHVIRDPRASLVSRRLPDTSAGTSRTDVHRYAKLIARSLNVARRNQERIGMDKYHVLRYEDLLTDPTGTLLSLREFLGIGDHAALQCPTVTGRPTPPNSSYQLPPDVEAVTCHSLEAFRMHLTDQESALIQRLAGSAAAHFGYTLDD